MHNDGLVQLQRQLQMSFEQLQLGFLRDGPVVVQPALAHSHRLRVVKQGLDGRKLRRPVAAEAGVGGGVLLDDAFRVDAQRRIHIGVLVGQRKAGTAGIVVGAAVHHTNHAPAGQLAQQSRAVLVELVAGVMGMGVKNGVHARFLSGWRCRASHRPGRRQRMHRRPACRQKESCPR